MKKIFFVTGSRADYGLLKELMFLINSDSDFESHIIVTGAHLSEKHGSTYKIVEADNLGKIHKIDLEIMSDKPSDISQGVGKGIISTSKLYESERPDLLILLGDRYELWGAAIPAALFNIPICHIHGGESTEGAIDEVVRHSLTKMSHLHFCSHETYRNRIISMGENPDNVVTVGALGLDRIAKMKFLTGEEIKNRIHVELGNLNILCTFHPVTLNSEASNKETDEVFSAIEHFIKDQPNVKFFVSLPNADMYSQYIREKWVTLQASKPENIFLFANLGDELYLSLMNLCDVILGNSSSGILEAPFLKKRVIDIGNRQKGRLTSDHVVHVKADKKEILEALLKTTSTDQLKEVKKLASIYGNGGSSLLIYKNLKKKNFSTLLTKKFFEGPSKN